MNEHVWPSGLESDIESGPAATLGTVHESARNGDGLSISGNEADDAPGDLVTRNWGGGVGHIGFVVDRKASSGHYQVVHNIGQAPKAEDVLFAWKITGHYRYFGPAQRTVEAIH